MMESKAKVAVSGSHGLVGSALVAQLARRGHRVSRLVRTTPLVDLGEIFWDPTNGSVQAGAMEGHDVIVHLAGESLASGRWTTEKKHRILQSRVRGTRLLAEAAAACRTKPKAFVSASAIGIYGNRGAETLTESSRPGDGFLADLCKAWERATDPARQAGIRVVHLRLGLVLSPQGGVLRRMIPAFRLGLGGVIGNGRQYTSWIALPDAVSAIRWAMEDWSLRGPVNVVSPYPVTNRDFTKALGAALGRPTHVPIPTFAARLAFGQMADELLLASTRVDPAKLRLLRFPFRYAHLGHALASMVGSRARDDGVSEVEREDARDRSIVRMAMG